jgi:YHS domain-containing protein
MSGVSNLLDRIDAEFSSAEQRVKQLRSEKVQEFQGRQTRLEQFEVTLDQLREIWQPRLEALAKKFGERVDVEPRVEPGRRTASFQFQSQLARIDLRFSVAPDTDVRNVVFTYDLEIIPILMKFDSHDEITFPLEAIDKTALARWFDDRIVSFVKTYLSLNENQYYLKDHMVEDPIAKVKFPKYAAGAKLEIKGKTQYFIDETTLREFQKQQAVTG